MKIERSGPAVRAALARFAPADLAEFEAEFGRAITAAATSLDLATAQEVLNRWWRIAAIQANPLTPTERDQLPRARQGDVASLLSHDDVGGAERRPARERTCVRVDVGISGGTRGCPTIEPYSSLHVDHRPPEVPARGAAGEAAGFPCTRGTCSEPAAGRREIRTAVSRG